jgi:hypothetical protein
MNLHGIRSEPVTISISKEALLSQLRQELLGDIIISNDGKVMKEVYRFDAFHYEYDRDATNTELAILQALDTIKQHLRD